MIIDQSPLDPIARDIMLEQGLPIKQVLQNGPRYTVVSTEVDDIFAVFKMVVPGAVNATFLEKPDPELDVKLTDVMLKEIRLLEFFTLHESELEGATPSLFRYSTDPEASWYLRELFPGKAAGHPRLPFRFDVSFYANFNPSDVLAYFASIQRLTSKVSPELLELFVIRWPNEVHLEQLIESLSEDYNLPVVRFNAVRISAFISRVMPPVFASRNVITHREPFGAHLFRHRDKLGLIDWERASLGHRLFDPAVVWLRSLDNEAWQQGFYDRLIELGYITTETAPIWDMLVLIDAIASYNFFSFNPLPDKDYHRQTMTSLVRIIESIITVRASS